VTTIRKDQSLLLSTEWDQLVDVINELHNPELEYNWNTAVDVHIQAMDTMEGHAWSVHTMEQMNLIGRNFLVWHREYLLFMEKKMQAIDPAVSIPYWDWTKDLVIPEKLSVNDDLENWKVTRNPDLSLLPDSQFVKLVMDLPDFGSFQHWLERVHNRPHRAIGMVMVSSASPMDPLFWLHHANIDRLWAEWQNNHPQATPPNLDEQLYPDPIITNQVKDLLDIISIPIF